MIKKLIALLSVLFLLPSCIANSETPSVNARPTYSTPPIQNTAQAETVTIQGVTIQVTFQSLKDNQLILPVTIFVLNDKDIWELGEPELKIGDEIILPENITEISLLPITDGGASGTARHFELLFKLPPSFNPPADASLKIPFIFSESSQVQNGLVTVDGPWIFDIPIA